MPSALCHLTPVHSHLTAARTAERSRRGELGGDRGGTGGAAERPLGLWPGLGGSEPSCSVLELGMLHGSTLPTVLCFLRSQRGAPVLQRELSEANVKSFQKSHP